MWNAGKVTDTECEGRQRDAYNQRPPATRLAPIPMRLRHCNDSATSKYRNNSNNTAKCECSAMYSYYDGLSASLCVLIDGLSALRDLIMMVSAFAMQASTTYSEASAPQSPIWFRPATRFGTRYCVSHGKSASSHPCYGAGMGAARSKYSRWCVLLAPGMHEHLHGLHT